MSASIEPGLYWRVKESFVRYVTSGAGGGVHVDDGAAADDSGLFRFPFRAARLDEVATGRIEFDGLVHFSGHFGMLSVPLRSPALTLSADGGELAITDPWSPHGQLVIATLRAGAAPVAIEGYFVWPPLEITLTTAGSQLFGDVYPEGSEMDALRIAVPCC